MTTVKKKKASNTFTSIENGVDVQKMVFPYEWKYELL